MSPHTTPALDRAALDQAAEVIRCMGHPVRLRIVEALARGECCVSDLQGTLDVPQAIVSQQLARLRAAGIVRARRDGQNVCYSIVDPRAVRLLDCLRHGESVKGGKRK